MNSGLTGDWDKLADLLNPKRMQAGLSRTVKRAGIRAVTAVQEGIVSGAPGGKAFKPLSDLTVEWKGSSTPLIDHGDLIGSITYQEIDLNTVWVGVKKGSRSSSGGDLVDIAWAHEFGCSIQVTPKMRAFMHGKGVHLRQETQYIVIPERSFLRATINDPNFRENIAQLYLSALKELFLP